MAIYEVKKNEKYIVKIHIGYCNGKRKTMSVRVYGRKKEAERVEQQLNQKYKNKALKDNLTMSQLIDEWLPSVKDKLARSTYNKYEMHCKKIKNGIGHIRLKNINARILEEYYNDLKKNSGLADRTISDNYAVVSDILNCAVRWEYIDSNPNSKAERIKYKKKEAEYYTPFEVQRLLEALDNERYQKNTFSYFRNKALILFAIDSGCRRGEITGLTWEDIDLTSGKVEINKATQYLSKYGTFEKETKTDFSNRTIYVSELTLETIKLWKREQDLRHIQLGCKWGNSKRVFTNDIGEDMQPNRPYKILQDIIKDNGLKRITFHDLRHTSATLLIARGRTNSNYQ